MEVNALLNVKEAGIEAEAMTPVVAEGPLLVTVTVKLTLLPLQTAEVLPLMVMPKSAVAVGSVPYTITLFISLPQTYKRPFKSKATLYG